MGKIKINFLSGTNIEKPLVTAFKGTNGDYVVFDNEISGSMGLPIILISKLEGSNLSKIADKSAEWDAVKESLRQIIAGSQTNYITVPLEVTAPDDFFTQLTLPVNSFDLLKNKYTTTSGDVLSATPVSPVAPAPEPVPAPVAPAVPVQEPVPAPVAPTATPTDLTADKEAFLKACENMFDALVAKFNK